MQKLKRYKPNINAKGRFGESCKCMEDSLPGQLHIFRNISFNKTQAKNMIKKIFRNYFHWLFAQNLYFTQSEKHVILTKDSIGPIQGENTLCDGKYLWFDIKNNSKKTIGLSTLGN